MARYVDSVETRRGDKVVGASVTVYPADTTTPASLFSNSGLTISKANPVTTDINGEFDFYVAAGNYDLEIEGAAIDTRTVRDVPIGSLATANVLAFQHWVETTGNVDGVNKIFTLPTAPVFGFAIMLKVKSQLLEENTNGYQFTRSGQVCTLGANVKAPAIGDPQPRAHYV